MQNEYRKESWLSPEVEIRIPTYFTNHSCDPNIWMKDAVTLIARRDIQIDEELTADYALWEGDENFVAAWSSKQCSLANSTQPPLHFSIKL